MADIINLPLLNQMDILECDECKETALNLYIKGITTLAYRCIACNYIGYWHIEEGEDDESETIPEIE